MCEIKLQGPHDDSFALLLVRESVTLTLQKAQRRPKQKVSVS